MNSIVTIAKCSHYARVESAIQRCLEPLGGMRAFIRPGDKTLLKVNLVSGHPVQDAVTTHPAVVAAVIKEVMKAGGIPSVGDSPALACAAAVAMKSGMDKVCDDLGALLVNLDDAVLETKAGTKLVRAFRISRKLSGFDVIINIPKLKTHCLVGMTGAVKNMFGCIPGKLKTAQHLIQQDPFSFSEMLLDLHGTVTPHLTIVDAVLGMEGPGPGSGYPRPFDLIIAGANAVAVDTVCARILGFTDKEVPTVWLAKQRGLDEAFLENICVMGERICDVAVAGLMKPRASLTMLLPRFVMNLGKSFLTAKPAVLKGACTGCANCVSICAACAIAMNDQTPVYDYKKCIRCYCCHEICPSRAIELKGGLLTGLLEDVNST
jgi:uncharacterized protein (DUF362 family)/Pyruvate/2-oxoacid:ferredoxin oxidoreductase delta subunit